MIKKENKLITAANFQDFDWNKAKFFYHIVKCGSFLKAARLAGLDQSVLRRQIKALEDQVGSPLLILNKPGEIGLTRKGEALLGRVAPFFLEMKGFCEIDHLKIKGEKKRRIRIVTTNALAAYVISDLIVVYNEANPHLIFEIIGEDQTIDIILNDADIAILTYDSKTEGIQQEHLFTLEKNLYASHKYLEKYGEPISVEDLKEHHFLSFPSSAGYPYSDVSWVLRIGMPKGKLRQAFFTSNSVECLVAAAKNGMGIMSGYEQMRIFRDSGLKIILPNVKDREVEWYFTYPNYLREDLEIIRIKQYLKEKLSPKEIKV